MQHLNIFGCVYSKFDQLQRAQLGEKSNMSSIWNPISSKYT